MAIYSMSKEMLEKLKADLEVETETLKKMRENKPQDMWMSDLEEFEVDYIAWQKDWYTEKKLPAPRMARSSVSKPKKLSLSRKVEETEISELSN